MEPSPASVACGSVKCLPMAKTVIRVMFDDATAAEGFLERCRGEGLDAVVEDCVNSVGVDLNTASAPLLRRVAGVSAATAKNIVAWREEEGAFTSRAQLKKVKGLGPKAYEQCAGFLRLPEAKNRLDATAVHPESYAAAKALELADAPVFALTQHLISGHSAKHIVAALAAWPVVRALQRAAQAPANGAAALTIR